MPQANNAWKAEWTRRQVEECKKSIKEELDATDSPLTPTQRLKHIFYRLEYLANADEPLAPLKRFIFIVSALFHHAKYGGLTTAKVEKLVDLGTAILKVHMISPNSKSLSFQYGELHLAASQALRRLGLHERSAWQQRLADLLGKRSKVWKPSFTAMASANRSLRLGFGALALKELEVVEAEEDASSDLFRRARLARIKALRLAGRLNESETLAKSTLSAIDLTADQRLDLDWELLWLDLIASQNARPLINAVRSGGTHEQASYVMEAFFLIRALKSKAFMHELPKTESLRRKEHIRPQRLGSLFACAVALENAYDTSVSLASRMEQVGKAIFLSNSVFTIDQQLLVLAAMSRWLIRAHSVSPARLAFSKYQSLSLSLSGGSHSDGVGVMADIDVTEWWYG